MKALDRAGLDEALARALASVLVADVRREHLEPTAGRAAHSVPGVDIGAGVEGRRAVHSRLQGAA